MQNNIKNRKLKILFSRLLAITIAIATVVTTIPPAEAHANGTGSTTDAGGNEGAGKKFKVGVGNNYMGWYRQTQGYRIYIINSKFERISPVYDFSLGRTDHEGTGWLDPVDWYKANVTEDDDTVYKTTTRFDTENSPTSGNKSWSFEKLQEWCTYTESSLSDLNYTATLPPVIYVRQPDATYVGNGTAFKDWFFAGQGGTNIQVGGTNTIKETEIIETEITDDGKINEGNTGTPNCTTCNDEGITTMPCPNCGGREQCTVCYNVGLFVIKCPNCNSDEINCDICKDIKICMFCSGTGRKIGTSTACSACSATGICQYCKASTGECSLCRGEGEFTCPTCNGTGKSISSVGANNCIVCIGRQIVTCPNCNPKVTCGKCDRNITAYGGFRVLFYGKPICIYCLYEYDNDGLCNKCGADSSQYRYCDKNLEFKHNAVDHLYTYYTEEELCGNCSNGLLTCSVCGAGYSRGSECQYCKCPLCNSQMTLKSKDNFYCSKCDSNVTYNQDVIKIEIPDSYWQQTIALTSNTKQEIEIGETIIHVAEQLPDQEKGQYWSNQPTYAKIKSSARSAIWLEFNAIFGTQTGADSTISPYDALLYATGIAGRDYKWESSTAGGRLTAYAIYQAFLDIQDSQEYKDCYYSIQPLNTAAAITNNQPTLLTNLIPLSGEDTTEDTKCKHDNIHPTEVDAMLCRLEKTGGLSPYKILATKPETITFPNGEYINALEALEDGCYLVVEPLIGVRIHLQENHGDSHGDDGYETHWTYGSFWNIAQEEWASDGESNWYNSYVMDLAPNCLVTTKEVETEEGYILHPAQNPDASKKISVSRKQMQNVQALYDGAEMHGLSMHIYGAEGIENLQTITFDESLINEDAADDNDYPYLIGASPDHTDRVAEEKRSDPTKYANIVKFYEKTDPESGETTYKVFTREKIPELIEIVNEEHLTGYKLIEWFTSDKLCTNLEDPEITWEKLFNNDGFDRGRTGQLSIEYKNKYGTITTGLEPYTMNTKQRLNTSTGIVTEVEENTLYLLYRVGDATTSTYDEELGEEIGPSPDDTHKLVERTDFESFSTHEKYTTTPATIVKFYEELDSEGNLISTEVFVRKEVPNTIVIEDESEFTGYALQEWFTASKYRAPKEEQTYAEFYESCVEWGNKVPAYWICNEASIVGLDPDTPEYEAELKYLFQILKFTTEEGEETGEQVLYLHYTKSPYRHQPTKQVERRVAKFMSETIIKQGYKLELGRKRTRITTYENLRLHTTNPIKEEKPKKIKPSIPQLQQPSDYADYNYYNRIKSRRNKIRELAYNSFEYQSAIMITLTFDTPTHELQQAHKQFKKFIQRVNSHYDGFRYLATFSKQKNGNWHYHVLCNFKPTTKNSTVRELWKNGITYITFFDKQSMFDTAIKYLISNMEDAAEDIKGKHGYLASDNLEKNIVLTSYKAEHEKEFDEAFQRVLDNKRAILYSTKNHLGIQGETVNEETGEMFTYTIPDRELDPALIQAGYSSWDSVFTHLSSSARFDEKFSILQTAVPKQKKFKRAKPKKSADASDQPVSE